MGKNIAIAVMGVLLILVIVGLVTTDAWIWVLLGAMDLVGYNPMN